MIPIFFPLSSTFKSLIQAYAEHPQLVINYLMDHCDSHGR